MNTARPPRFTAVRPIALMGLLLMMLLLAACSTGSAAPTPTPSPAAPPPTPAPADDLIDTAEELMGALLARDIIAEDAGTSEPFLLDKGAHLLTVNGQQISVWEYDSVEEADAARLFLQGPNSPLAYTDFIAAPRFFQSGSMIVLFVATEPVIVQALTDILGQPFI